MKTRNAFLTTSVIASLMLAATVSPTLAQAPPPPSTPDASGDTFGIGAVQHDILSTRGYILEGSLLLELTFAGNIAAPSTGSPLSLVGFVELDVDSTTLTGSPTLLNVYGADTGLAMGVDYTLDLFSESAHAGSIDIVDEVAAQIIGSAPIQYSSNSLLITVPVSLLGGNTGPVNYGVVVGTMDGIDAEATDKAPDGATPLLIAANAAPEPGTLTLLGIGLLVGQVARRRPRR